MSNVTENHLNKKTVIDKGTTFVYNGMITMAKITYTSLVNKISGKLGGSTVKGGKGGNVLSGSQQPSGRVTIRQHYLRKLESDLSGQWYNLSIEKKALWDKYASLRGGHKTGFNVYVGANMVLAMAEHTDLVEIDTPPLTPSTPEHIGGFDAMGALPVLPGFYQRDEQWAIKGFSIAFHRYTLTAPKLTVDINNVLYSAESETDIILSSSDNWDTTSPTDYTVAANRAGKNFYVYACVPSSGVVPDFVVSASSTTPSGYTLLNSRKVAGFHCLCVAVGTISGHTLTGFVVGNILPASVWDLEHRPVCSPEGMVYSDRVNVWVDIYLPSQGLVTIESIYGGTILDNRAWVTFVHDGGLVGKRLLRDIEFQLMAVGSNEETNIAGGADPVTTGGHSDTAGQRMIGNIGVEDACGVLWQWLDEQSYRFDDGHQHTVTITHKASATGSFVRKDQAETNFNAVLGSGADETVDTSSVDAAPSWSFENLPGAKGSFYKQGTYGDVKLVGGGRWNSGALAGSRSRSAYYSRWVIQSFISTRFGCNPL